MTVHTITNHHIFPLLLVYFSVKYIYFRYLHAKDYGYPTSISVAFIAQLVDDMFYSAQLNKHISAEREITVNKNVLKEIDQCNQIDISPKKCINIRTIRPNDIYCLFIICFGGQNSTILF